MTPSPRARFSITPISLSLAALLAAACGASSDPSSADVPEFPGSRAAPPSSPAPGAMPPSGNPDSVEPGGMSGGAETPAVTNETPPEVIALEPSQPAPMAMREAPSAEQPQTEPGPTAPPEQPAPQVPASSDRPRRGTANAFTDLLGIPVGEVDAKVRLVVDRIFGIGTNESAIPQANTGYRVYYELPQDPSQAFIWCADANDVRSEGQSYGMMIAVQMNMQAEFDKLWRFAQQRMQFVTNDAWNRYFRWQGQVTVNGNNINVNFGQNGPAPDGDEYFAAAL